MNKESIYKIIGYHGRYTDSVKKALKKLLKENHPDCKGNADIFKLVNEVKKELENNQVSFEWDRISKPTKYEDIDYDYCRLMIDKIKKEIEILNKERQDLQEEIASVSSNYRQLYRKSIHGAELILNKSNYYNKLNNIKMISLILTIILVITFLIAAINNSLLLFIIFGIGCIFTIIIVERYFNLFHNITKRSEENIRKYLKSIDNLKKNAETKELLSKKILNNERIVNRKENDLRFYKNLLK